MQSSRRLDLFDDLFVPTLFFAALGGMSWAVRGCVGFGGTAGCIFAGVLWGVGWWFLAQSSDPALQRRYRSGWIVLALTIGIGIAGARGWMQWKSFFLEQIYTDYSKGAFQPIPRIHGFIWLFVAGMPWAGLGACMLAWCAPARENRALDWILRFAMGIGAAFLGNFLFEKFPNIFLPLYSTMGDRYRDLENNPTLRRVINDNRNAIIHLFLYLGFLGFETVKRDWKNVVLIATVGIANGAGWALLQNWTWAPAAFPGFNFNWWRCWESSGGISIGVALGIAWFLVNRPMSEKESVRFYATRPLSESKLEWLLVFLGLLGLWAYLLFVFGVLNRWQYSVLGVLAVFGILYTLLFGGGEKDTMPAPYRSLGDRNLERLAVYLGLIMGLSSSLANGLRGRHMIFHSRDNEDQFAEMIWQYLGPAVLGLVVVVCLWSLVLPSRKRSLGEVFPGVTILVLFALIWQNAIAQWITAPLSNWNEFCFAVYYVLLFLITAMIVAYHSRTACKVVSTPST